MGVAELLTVLFVALKLLGIIDWSWIIVLLPVMISFTLYVVAFIGIIFLHMIGVKSMKRKFNKWDN